MTGITNFTITNSIISKIFDIYYILLLHKCVCDAKYSTALM